MKEAYAKWEPSDEIAPNCFSANKDDCRIPKLKNYPAVYKEVEKTFLVEALPTVFYVKMVDTIVVKQASAKWEFSNEYDPNCISANKEDCRIPKLVNYPAEYGYRDRLVEWVNYKKRNHPKDVFVKKNIQIFYCQKTSLRPMVCLPIQVIIKGEHLARLFIMRFQRRI